MGPDYGVDFCAEGLSLRFCGFCGLTIGPRGVVEPGSDLLSLPIFQLGLFLSAGAEGSEFAVEAVIFAAELLLVGESFAAFLLLFVGLFSVLAAELFPEVEEGWCVVGADFLALFVEALGLDWVLT